MLVSVAIRRLLSLTSDVGNESSERQLGVPGSECFLGNLSRY